MNELLAELDRSAAIGHRVTFWLRDDDAVTATPALERLMSLATTFDIPVVLAVIPMPAEPELARSLAGARARIALHGFAHRNHAGPGEKKQELGAHRPAAMVLEELARARDRLDALFPGRTVAMLVPPWNRIAADLIPHLPGLGLRWLSAFGPEPPYAPAADLIQIDCQLDIMDWRTRRSHPADVLADRLAELVRQRLRTPGPIGILTHHLVHDDAAWTFLADLFRLTTGHAAATWDWPVEDFGNVNPSVCPAR
jgi:hypothetical protein